MSSQAVVNLGKRTHNPYESQILIEKSFLAMITILVSYAAVLAFLVSQLTLQSHAKVAHLGISWSERRR